MTANPSAAAPEAPTLPTATILGYPRIGRRRELKRAIESFWKGSTSEAQLQETARELRAATRARLVELGLPAAGGAVPESFSFYDQVLDATIALGAIPHRFAGAVAESAGSDLAVLFALARGDKDHQPLEMTKWFDTNYHYSVPELDERTPLVANPAALVAQVAGGARTGHRVPPRARWPRHLSAPRQGLRRGRPGFPPRRPSGRGCGRVRGAAQCARRSRGQLGAARRARTRV